jgi:glyceraldehyde 3-phosphate dehydrogenase
MAVKVAINGFGRIGRLVFRALVEQGLLGTKLDVVAVGDIVPADNLAYLLKYDSTQGRFVGTVGSKKSSPDKAEDDVLVVNGKEILVVSAKTPAELPWAKLGVQVVIESTGLFTECKPRKSAHGHIKPPAPRRSSSPPRPRTRTSPSSSASTTTSSTSRSTTSSPTPPARRTASRRSCTCS